MHQMRFAWPRQPEVRCGPRIPDVRSGSASEGAMRLLPMFRCQEQGEGTLPRGCARIDLVGTFLAAGSVK